MGTFTSPDGLYKPDDQEDGWGTLVRDNWDIIQAKLKPSLEESYLTVARHTIVSNAGIYRSSALADFVAASDFNTAGFYIAKLTHQGVELGGTTDDGVMIHPSTVTDTSGYWGSSVTFPTDTVLSLKRGRYQWDFTYIFNASTAAKTQAYTVYLDLTTSADSGKIRADSGPFNYVLPSVWADGTNAPSMGNIEVYEDDTLVVPYLDVAAGLTIATTVRVLYFNLRRIW